MFTEVQYMLDMTMKMRMRMMMREWRSTNHLPINQVLVMRTVSEVLMKTRLVLSKHKWLEIKDEVWMRSETQRVSSPGFCCFHLHRLLISEGMSCEANHLRERGTERGDWLGSVILRDWVKYCTASNFILSLSHPFSSLVTEVSCLTRSSLTLLNSSRKKRTVAWLREDWFFRLKIHFCQNEEDRDDAVTMNPVFRGWNPVSSFFLHRKETQGNKVQEKQKLHPLRSSCSSCKELLQVAQLKLKKGIKKDRSSSSTGLCHDQNDNQASFLSYFRFSSFFFCLLLLWWWWCLAF